MDLDVLYDRFWDTVLRGLMSFTGWDSTTSAKAALYLSLIANTTGVLRLYPIPMMMDVVVIFWLSKRLHYMRQGNKLGISSIPISESDAQLIKVMGIGAVGSIIPIFVLSAVIANYYIIGIPVMIGALSFSAGCNFMLNIQPPRKNIFRRALNWLKNHTWGLSGSHMPAPI